MMENYENRSFSAETPENLENNQNIKSFYSDSKWYQNLDLNDQIEIDSKINHFKEQLSDEELEAKYRSFWHYFAKKEMQLLKIEKILQNNDQPIEEKVSVLMNLKDEIKEDYENFESRGINPELTYSKIYDSVVKLIGNEKTRELYNRRNKYADLTDMFDVE